MTKRVRFMVIGLVSFLLILFLGVSAAAASIEFSGISEGKVIAGIQTIKLDVKASKNEKIKNVKVYLGNEVIYQTEYAPYQFLLLTTELSDGVYTLRAVVETSSGTEEAQRTVKVENYPAPSGKLLYSWDFEEESKDWGGDPDLIAELSDESVFEGNYSAKYSGTYKFTTICKDNTVWGTHSGTTFLEISPNRRYYIQAWVKIDKIDTEHFDLKDLSIKLNAMIRNESDATTQKVYSTMAYDFNKMGTWQKLCVEFQTNPDAALFYVRIETIGPTSEILKPDKTIDIELYLDEVKIIEL